MSASSRVFVVSEYGDIQECAVIMDRDTGRPKGFAFITFASQQAAEQALAQDGKDLDGRPLKVAIAQERAPRRDGGGGGGGRW